MAQSSGLLLAVYQNHLGDLPSPSAQATLGLIKSRAVALAPRHRYLRMQPRLRTIARGVPTW